MGASAKPAKDVKVSDRLQLRAGEQDWEVIVQGLNEQRRPAPEAQLLYQETPDSLQQRTQAAELRKLAPAPAPDHQGPPDGTGQAGIEPFSGRLDVVIERSSLKLRSGRQD